MSREGSAPRKLSIRDVVRDAGGFYRRYWRELLVVAFVVFAPIAALDVLSEGVRDVETDDGWVVAEAVVAGFGLGVAAMVGDVFYTGVVAAAVGMHRGGVRRDLAEIARHLPYLTLIAVDLLFALAVATGLVLFVIPGVIAFTWFALAPAVVEIEGSGVRASFARSRRLVRGSFWRVLALLGPVSIVGEALGAWLGDAGPWLLGEGEFGDWLGEVLADVATAPLFALAVVVVTHQLIARSPDAPSSGATPPAPLPSP